MIVNNTITSITPPTPLTWAPDSLFQATLLSAVLLTVLSYQVTSVIYHLLLGIKPRDTATATHFHSLLLSEESSPLSTIAAITRNDTLDALRHRLPLGTVFTRTASSITPTQVFLLLLLLVTAPIINIITVALAFESSKDLSFASTNVLLALGVGNTAINTSRYVKGCERLHNDFKGERTAQFLFCADSVNYRPLFRSYNQHSRIKATAGLQGDLLIEIFITGANYSAVLNVYADVSIHPRTYRLAHAIDQQSMGELSEVIAKRVQEACDEPDFFTSASTNSIRQIGGSRVPLVEGERFIDCTTVQPDGRIGTGMIIAAGSVFTEMVTLVDVPELLLLDTAEIRRNVSGTPPWIVGNDLPVMTKREPIAPVIWIAVALGTVLIIRVVVESFTNDDIADGLEAIVVSRLGFRSGYELIRSEDCIRYNRVVRSGDQLHYGIPRPGWEEVEKFDRPVGVLWQDEESFPEMKLNTVLDENGTNSNSAGTDTQDSS